MSIAMNHVAIRLDFVEVRTWVSEVNKACECQWENMTTTTIFFCFMDSVASPFLEPS